MALKVASILIFILLPYVASSMKVKVKGETQQQLTSDDEAQLDEDTNDMDELTAQLETAGDEAQRDEDDVNESDEASTSDDETVKDDMDEQIAQLQTSGDAAQRDEDNVNESDEASTSDDETVKDDMNAQTAQLQTSGDAAQRDEDDVNESHEASTSDDETLKDDMVEQTEQLQTAGAKLDEAREALSPDMDIHAEDSLIHKEAAEPYEKTSHDIDIHAEDLPIHKEAAEPYEAQQQQLSKVGAQKEISALMHQLPLTEGTANSSFVADADLQSGRHLLDVRADADLQGGKKASPDFKKMEEKLGPIVDLCSNAGIQCSAAVTSTNRRQLEWVRYYFVGEDGQLDGEADLYAGLKAYTGGDEMTNIMAGHMKTLVSIFAGEDFILDSNERSRLLKTMKLYSGDNGLDEAGRLQMKAMVEAFKLGDKPYMSEYEMLLMMALVDKGLKIGKDALIGSDPPITRVVTFVIKEFLQTTNKYSETFTPKVEWFANKAEEYCTDECATDHVMSAQQALDLCKDIAGEVGGCTGDNVLEGAQASDLVGDAQKGMDDFAAKQKANEGITEG